MATNVFNYKNAAFSSQLPTITIPEGPILIGGKPAHRSAAEISRPAFWDSVIRGAAAMLSVGANETPVYIATGGGYGSNELIGYAKKEGLIASQIPSINGNMFRTLPAFVAESDLVKAAIKQHIGPEANDEDVQRIYSSFYSDEINTCMTKGVVIEAIMQQKSCIHESGSLYPDTLERAQLAEQHGLRTMLIAGYREIDGAIQEKQTQIEPANIVRSYQVFAERFERELIPAFSEIHLYNTNDPSRPILIAHKASADQPLKILDQKAYDGFIAQQYLDPEPYKSKGADFNAIHDDWKKRQAGRPQGPIADLNPREPGQQ